MDQQGHHHLFLKRPFLPRSARVIIIIIIITYISLRKLIDCKFAKINSHLSNKNVLSSFLNESLLREESFILAGGVRHLPRYEAPSTYLEHCSFRVQTKLICVIFYTFSSSPCPYPSPTTSTFLQADTQSFPLLHVPHAHTISIYHASPPQPRSEHPKDYTRPHFASYHKLTKETLIDGHRINSEQ